MTYEELVKAVKGAYGKADASKVSEHVAIQFDVKGEGEGAFYVEIADGKVNVEPFEYYDNDAKVVIASEDLVAMTEGKLDIEKAVSEGKVTVEGNVEKAMALKALAVKKAAAKKPAAKKTAAVKVAAEKPAAKKPATKTATAKKPAAKKTEVKAETAKKTEVKAETAKKTEAKTVAKKPATK